MGWGKDFAAVTLAAGIAFAAGEDIAGHGTHHEHTPGTYFGTMVTTSTSAAAFNAAEWSTFRVDYAHPIETLTDGVSERLPRSPATFVLK